MCIFSLFTRSLGLPQAHRLKHWRDFRTVYQQGKRAHSGIFVLVALSSPGEAAPSQLGVSISKKVSKKAVIRNRLKRQIHGAFLQLRHTIPGGWKLILVVKPAAKECESEHFLRELKKLLLKLEIIHGH